MQVQELLEQIDKERQAQDRKLKKLSNENIELLERIDTLNSVLSSSKEEIMKFDNLDKEKQVQDRKLEKLSNKNRELLEQIDTLNSDLKSSEEEITNLSSHNQIIESKRQESKVEIVCLKQKCDALEHQLGEAKIDIEKFEIRANEAEREIDNLEQERQMQDRELEELSNENRELLEQIETLNTDKELQESNKEKITNLKSQIQIVSSSLENETVNLMKRCEALESFFTVIKKRYKELYGGTRKEGTRVPLERSEIEQLELRLLELNPCREEITKQN